MRLLLSGPVHPFDAMAVDEALLTLAAEPTLRLYRWSPHGVSLGYFQNWRDFPFDRFAAERVPVVRRLTGGGAIYHGDEITFSLVAPSQHPLFAGAVRSSYERVHATLARALEARLPPGVTVSVRCTDVLASDVKGSPWCFHDSTDLDMAAHGRKLVGSAQRRTGGRILHHGSLILRPNRFTPEIASVESLGGDPDPASLERAIVESASRDWNVTLDARQLSASEEHLARELAASKYGSDAWTRRR